RRRCWRLCAATRICTRDSESHDNGKCALDELCLKLLDGARCEQKQLALLTVNVRCQGKCAKTTRTRKQPNGQASGTYHSRSRAVWRASMHSWHADPRDRCARPPR